MTRATTLLILGASGDLTRRLLLPGLASMLAVEPDRQVRVVGADRAELSQDDFADRVRQAFATTEVTEAVTEAVAGQARYLQADLLDAEQLSGLLGSVEAPLVVYFALPPRITTEVCELLETLDLPPETRLALEKPFGRDRESAEELNTRLLRIAPEERIHRVDHFLGVNTVLNLVGLRFANRILQPIWSGEHIERVTISYDETLALEGRAGYYDGAGALVDMIQSHLLQVLAFFAMEAPASLDAQEVRSLKAQVLRATEVWDSDPVSASRRGRYTAGEVGGHAIPSYVEEDGVDPARGTETLAEVVVEIRNGRWSGTPFVLRSGKALAEDHKEIEVVFKSPAHVPSGLRDSPAPDRLLLELRPGAVTLELSMNAEGDPFELEQKDLYVTLGQPRMTPYGEVLAGILDGDPLLSIRGDIAEDCWRIVDPVLRAWAQDRVPMQEYAAGSAGPAGSWGTIPEITGA